MALGRADCKPSCIALPILRVLSAESRLGFDVIRLLGESLDIRRHHVPAAKRPVSPKSSASRERASDRASVEAELASFIDKFEPSTAKLIRQCRAEVRKLLPAAVELVYDNYRNHGYCKPRYRLQFAQSLSG